MNDAENRKPGAAAQRKHAGTCSADTSLPKQERARATRRELIEAARHIFSRDGFENARLEEIASEAGKTRGAFYDHFRDKEDIFFAIFEEDIVRSKASLRSKATRTTSLTARREALIDHFTDLLADRKQRLLYIEFKLYAIRHAQGEKRLADLNAEMCFETSHQLDGLYPEFTEGSRAQRRRLLLKIGALIDGLALNQLFDPRVLGHAATRAMVATGVNDALGPVRKKSPVAASLRPR